MASRAAPSETLAWWARAAQARRIAGLLSPRDARVAEAYAAECEDHARAASFRALPSVERLTGIQQRGQRQFCEAAPVFGHGSSPKLELLGAPQHFGHTNPRAGILMGNL